MSQVTNAILVMTIPCLTQQYRQKWGIRSPRVGDTLYEAETGKKWFFKCLDSAHIDDQPTNRLCGMTLLDENGKEYSVDDFAIYYGDFIEDK